VISGAMGKQLRVLKLFFFDVGDSIDHDERADDYDEGQDNCESLAHRDQFWVCRAAV
jgi:hypothetical protein